MGQVPCNTLHFQARVGSHPTHCIFKPGLGPMQHVAFQAMVEDTCTHWQFPGLDQQCQYALGINYALATLITGLGGSHDLPVQSLSHLGTITSDELNKSASVLATHPTMTCPKHTVTEPGQWSPNSTTSPSSVISSMHDVMVHMLV